MDKINQFLKDNPQFKARYGENLVIKYKSIRMLYDEEYCDMIFEQVFKDLLEHGCIIW